jgi:calcineurin-like phosphoesterase family protein
MKRFWTSDIHFGHANIVKYCNRPYLRKGDLIKDKITGIMNWSSRDAALKCAERMNISLIKSINGRVKEDDVVVHVGDFANYGKVRGVEGLRVKPMNYLSQLNGSWVMIKGNHDPNNHIKTIGDYLITNIGPYQVFVSHYPSDSIRHDTELISWVSRKCHFVICGHVHEKWAERWIDNGYTRPIFNINVGVDVRRYMPIDDAEIINIYMKATRKKC